MRGKRSGSPNFQRRPTNTWPSHPSAVPQTRRPLSDAWRKTEMARRINIRWMRAGQRGGRAQPGPGAHKKGGEKGAAGAASTGRSGAYLYARGRRPDDLGRERSGDGRITADGLGAGCSAARGRPDTGIGREGIVVPSPLTIMMSSDPRVGSRAWRWYYVRYIVSSVNIPHHRSDPPSWLFVYAVCCHQWYSSSSWRGRWDFPLRAPVANRARARDASKQYEL